MSLRSKISSVAGRLKGAVRKVKMSVASAAGWFSRGYILSTAGRMAKGAADTFKSACGGYVESGLVRVSDSDMFVYLSDIDGTDLLEQFKQYVQELLKKYPDSSPPVKVFTATGVLGMYARVEMTYVMVYGGIPYIFPVHRSISGIDEHDADFDDSMNQVVTRMCNSDSNHVVSLGYVDDTVNVNDYVLDWSKKSPLLDAVDIDPNLVKMAIHEGKMSPIGSLYLPGRYMYDIYVIDKVLGKAIRPYRDYTVADSNIPESGNEVILVGGDPDIVLAGMQPSPDGFVYEAWVPNSVRYYGRAVNAVRRNLLPLGQFVVDDEEYLECYAMLLKMLRDLDEEVNGSSQETDAPDMMNESDVRDENDDDAEVPVLLELPF